MSNKKKGRMGGQQQKVFLRQLWSKEAPWYLKVSRTSVMAIAGIAAIPYAVGNLPGDPLPTENMAPLQKFYGARVAHDDTRLHSSKAGDFFLSATGNAATTYGSLIIIPQQMKDRLGEKTNPMDQYILSHEMAHVLQDDQLSFPGVPIHVLFEKISNLLAGRGLSAQYEYVLQEGKSFNKYGVEQQASILADYYNITHGLEPLLLANTLDRQSRDRLYETVLAGVLKNRNAPAPKTPAPSV